MTAQTIAAIATPPGRGALAMIRVSGERGEVERAVGAVVTPWPLQPREARLCNLRDPESGELLDRAMVVHFRAPRSYTGEDVVELTVHGGAAVAPAVLAALVAAGAREAEPGEFTRRAVLAGKMDLVQAEAVGDLTDARTSAARQAALNQVDGGLSRRIAELRGDIIGLEALIAYDIDFPEEDDGPVSGERILSAASRVTEGLQALLATAAGGSLVRDGAVVVIAGPPNAGKSSLFNALLGEERAIVTEIAGTTRDAVEALLDTRPIPLRLVDTAGLRETRELVERIGIEAGARWLARAHLVVACGETDQDALSVLEKIRTITTAPITAVRTKADLTGELAGSPRSQPSPLAVSAHTGAGLSRLLQVIQETLARDRPLPTGNAPIVTRARQRRALSEALAELKAFGTEWSSGRLPAPVAAVHTRAAIHALETLIGGVDVEEVLGRVFSEFCVGK